jgi:FMN reductase
LDDISSSVTICQPLKVKFGAGFEQLIGLAGCLLLPVELESGRSVRMRESASRLIQVAGICGSLRKDSFTRMALQIALEGANEAGAQIRLMNLSDYQLIFCDGKDDESTYPDDVFRLREDVAAAQGIILATPDYHGGYSGVLKNALDLMGSAQFKGKVTGLLGVSGGSLGAIGALNGLREVCRSLHAWVIPEQAVIAEVWEAFDTSGTLKDAELERRLKEVGRQVARFAYLHEVEKSLNFAELMMPLS